MSANIPEKLNTCLVVDPICDFVEPLYAVEKSPQINYFYKVQSSNTSTTSTNFTVNINSNDTITDRVFILEQKMRISVVGESLGAGNPYLTSNANIRGALRSFPLTKWMNSLTVTIGNSATTIQIGDMISALERYGLNNKFLNYSLCPIYPDNSTQYRDELADGVAIVVSNPLATYIDTVDDIIPRGAFPLKIVYNDDNRVDFDVVLYEPIFASPLLQSLVDRKQGLSHLSQIQVQINWGNPQRLWSTNDTQAVVSILTAEAPFSSALHVVQYIPGLLDLKAPAIQTLAWNELDRFTIQMGPVPALSSTSISSNVVQLSRIPQELYVYARPNNSMYNGTPWNPVANFQNGSSIPDRFLSMNSCVVNFNGQTFLSNAEPIDLYRISRANGCNMPWIQWAGKGLLDYRRTNDPNVQLGNVDIPLSGSVLCLKFGKDIPLTNASWAPGTSMKANLQVTANFTNQETEDNDGILSYDLYMIVVYEGSMSFYGSNTTSQTVACLNETDVLDAIKENNRVHYDVIHDDALGGSIFSKLKSFFTKERMGQLANTARKVIDSDLYKGISKATKTHLRKDGPSVVADVADALGLGMTGGKKMSKQALKKKLLNM